MGLGPVGVEVQQVLAGVLNVLVMADTAQWVPLEEDISSVLKTDWGAAVCNIPCGTIPGMAQI